MASILPVRSLSVLSPRSTSVIPLKLKAQPYFPNGNPYVVQVTVIAFLQPQSEFGVVDFDQQSFHFPVVTVINHSNKYIRLKRDCVGLLLFQSLQIWWR